MIIRRFHLLAALVFSLSAVASAANLNVTPVRVELSGARPYGVIQITNVADEPVTMQAQIFRWGFKGEEEDLAATRDVILNPPLIKLAPKGQQFIRVGLRVPNTTNSETTYRLVLEELPPNAPGSGTTVRTLLRISIPVFANAKTKTAPKVNWSVFRTQDGKLRLRAINNGTAHIQIRTLKVSDAKNPSHQLTSTIPVYLLQAQAHEWPLDGFEQVGDVQLEAATDAGDERTVVQPSKD